VYENGHVKLCDENSQEIVSNRRDLKSRPRIWCV